jgi:hypothetical protein
MASVAAVTFGAAALAATLLSGGPAAAIDHCMECRVVAHLRSCDKPIEGKSVFQGRVVRAEAFGCSQLLSIDVVRPADAGLPPKIQVALTPCAVWEGRSGDVIDVAVVEPLSLENGLYTLACRHW